MTNVVRLCDYHLRKVEDSPQEARGELVRFAKEGGPVVANSDPWAGKHCDGIENLPSQFPDWDVG